MNEATGWELEDVEDIRTYSAAIVRNKFPQLPEQMRDEARQEAICLVYELHKKWKPEKCPSFRDYLSTYLYLRLVDWWRTTRVHDGGVKNEDGTYDPPTVPSGFADDFVPDIGVDPHASPYDLLVDLGTAA